MITRRTKLQLLIFAIITAVGVTYVGARYARLDKLVRDDSYTVVASFSDSGGMFAGSQVTYRGVAVGSVDKLVLTDDGVDAYLDIEKSWDAIPADAKAVVGNRSAIGEQYVELQPQVDDGPFLAEGSTIDESMTELPIQTDVLLENISNTVESVDLDALRTSVSELGKAFGGSGEDLQRIIDTGTSFIQAADDNFEITRQLIRDGNTVLDGQLASESALRTFASQLALFSTSLADADPDLRKIIDDGSFAANQLRGFLDENRVEFGDLLNNLITTGEITVRNLPGIQQVLVIYPYAVEGAFTVVSKDSDTGLYDAHFGLIITTNTPCHGGYESTVRRSPSDGSNLPMNTKAGCTEPATKSNARGPQNLPQNRNRVSTDYDQPVAAFDPETGEVTWADEADLSTLPTRGAATTVAPRTSGEESWTWLYQQPMVGP
ncbi:MCE family protein [Nocardioides sp. R-C-SC26]|uniref:MCE family protein n=1 Tax=Nocardioides sp. R-C-SC26 TaxID=2870414 RepID=UPI001E35A623|nr:MlaD family protein [Nocardioides sp. R-C-SC26]